MIPPEFLTWQAITMLLTGLVVGIVVGATLIVYLEEKPCNHQSTTPQTTKNAHSAINRAKSSPC